jgi:dihydropteroate synthase
MVMGIVNVTPDSFSDGGQYFDLDLAVRHGVELAGEGADILDIGGESTRPGAEPVSVEEELRRVLPVIRALREQTKALISIDTFKARVAREAIAAGADIVNDVSGLMHDAEMLSVIQGCDAGVVLMHMKGEPRTMQWAFFDQRLAMLAEAGVDVRRVILDPGIGFGKALEHNLELLRALPALRSGERPLMIGVSRKSMIGKLIGSDAIADRAWPTVALTSYVREHGASVVRVHEVGANVQAMRMTEAILGAQ